MSLPLPSHVRLERGPSSRNCPACGKRAMGFYAVDRIPVHSCVLLPDEASATAFPRADLELAHCEHCGFVFNPAFDSSRIDYSEDYEETQGCSGTFNAWLEGVIERLLAHGLEPGSHALELGCGRGDFLEKLCRMGDLRGTGIDPSATAGRVDPSAGRGLTFLRAPYGPEHYSLQPDLVVCRHTLEHLPEVESFVRSVRRGLEAKPEALVFFEVPDVVRQLDEGAFWDVYYEHCSYFGQGSLARLFARCGFEVLEVVRTYGDQYLQLLARPAVQELPLSPEYEDREALRSGVASFENSCRHSLGFWNQQLEEAMRAGEKVVLWGSGSKGTGFLTTLGADAVRVGAVVDINPAKHGRFMAGTGQPILAPEALVEWAPNTVIIMNPIYREEIGADLRALGLQPRLLAVGADGVAK